MVKWSLDGLPTELYPTPPLPKKMVAIAKNRRFAKIHLKIISSETAGPTLSQVSDYRLLGASSCSPDPKEHVSNICIVIILHLFHLFQFLSF